MELVPGISAHFVQSKKFKTNKITIRFTASLSLETVAGRMLSASMLEQFTLLVAIVWVKEESQVASDICLVKVDTIFDDRRIN